MGSVGKALGSVAKIAAPIVSVIPGAGPVAGAITGAVGSVLSGSGASSSANAATAAQQKIANSQAAAYNQYYAPLLSAYAQNAGYDPATGTFDPNYNPYGGQVGDAMYNQYAEATDKSYDQAANQLTADAMSRGFSGYNTGATSALSAVRSGEASDLAGFRRDLLVKGEQEEQQRLANLLPMIAGTGQTAVGNLQGLGANYASQAANQGAALGDLASVLGQSGALSSIGGTLGQWLSGRKQSDSTGTTTANPAPAPTTNAYVNQPVQVA